ncbi:MAG: hypothetical protein AAFR87_22725 [Bacteroidota bacterium]
MEHKEILEKLLISKAFRTLPLQTHFLSQCQMETHHVQQSKGFGFACTPYSCQEQEEDTVVEGPQKLN